MGDKIFYKRNLPHYQPPYATYFVTFRLANSLPLDVIDALKKQNEEEVQKIKKLSNKALRDKKLYNQSKRYFGKFDSLLDSTKTGAMWLKEVKIASIVYDAIRFRDRTKYSLDAFCIMSNHVHLLAEVTPGGDLGSPNRVPTYILTERLKSLKMFTASESNKILRRKGQFWHKESYDHVVRGSREFERILNYIKENPVRAGLVKNWKEWKWTYVKDGLS